MGGFGIRKAVQHAHGAYIASVRNAALLDAWDPSKATGWSEAVNNFLHFSGKTREWFDSDHDQPLSQRFLSQLVDKHSFELLLDSFSDSPRDLARLYSVCDSGANSWLGVIPSKALLQAYDSREYSILTRICLGLKLNFVGPDTCPFCKDVMDPYGYHALTCRKGGCLGVRHNAVRNAFLRFCKLCGISDIKCEATDLFQGSNDRPADALLPSNDSTLYIKHFLSSSPVCLDFAVINSQQLKYIHKAGVMTGAATTDYERKVKFPRYSDACADNDLSFIPMVVDSFGSWGPSSKPVFTYISKTAALNRLANTDIAECYLRQTLSVTLQRYNALSILKHYVSPSLDESSCSDTDADDPRPNLDQASTDSSDETSSSSDDDSLSEPEETQHNKTTKINQTKTKKNLVTLEVNINPEGLIALDILPWKPSAPNIPLIATPTDNPSLSSTTPLSPPHRGELDLSREATRVRLGQENSHEDIQETNPSPIPAACPDTPPRVSDDT